MRNRGLLSIVSILVIAVASWLILGNPLPVAAEEEGPKQVCVWWAWSFYLRCESG